MKCPHCLYVDREYVKDEKTNTLVCVEGSEGAFYELPVELERNDEYYRPQRKYLYACPDCNKTFIQ